MALDLTSKAFEAGGTIPDKYTCEGQNVSPPLTWRGASPETESLVLICDDPDAPRGTWSHWVLYHIPAERDELAEGVSPQAQPSWGGLQGRNDFGDVGYGGPCPPRGETHRYYFRLYALDVQPDLPQGANRQQVLDQIDPHILERTELMARYGRS